jgi:hypothetical protein
VCFAVGAGGAGCINDGNLDGNLDDNEGVSSAAIAIDVNSAYILVGVQSNKCVGVADSSTANNARVEIETCSGQPNQRFQPEAMGGGFFRMRNARSGLCVDVTGVSQVAGAAVIQFTCGTGLNQQWSFTDVAGGAERITVRHSGQVLDVTLQSTADGTPLEQWPSNGGGNQQFVLNAALPALVP